MTFTLAEIISIFCATYFSYCLYKLIKENVTLKKRNKELLVERDYLLKENRRYERQ